MWIDDVGLSPAEKRATEALRRVLRDPDAEARIALRARMWKAPARRRDLARLRWAAALACVLVVASIGAAALGVWPGTGPASGALASPTPVPTLPGTPGHFDNGEFSFDYPTDWQVLAVDVPESCSVVYVTAVVGVGSWALATNEVLPDGAQRCGLDTVTVAPGGIVVRIWWRGGGPAPMCVSPAPTSNASAGPNAVVKTVDGDVTSWEFAQPGLQFGWPNNPIFEVHTSDAGQLAKAEAMVASFRWDSGLPSSGQDCNQDLETVPPASS